MKESIAVHDRTETEPGDDGYTKYLIPFGLMAQNELQTMVAKSCIADELKSMPSILARWQGIQPKVRALLDCETNNRFADSCLGEPIPEEAREQVMEEIRRPEFQRTFGRTQFTLEMVEIDKLVASQRTINLDYVGLLLKKLTPNPELRDVVALCLASSSGYAAVNYMETGGGAHVFTSANDDLRFLGVRYVPPVGDSLVQAAASGGVPVGAVMAFVGFGAHQVSAFRIGDRVILSNGFHRVYCLRAAGVRRIPVVVQRIDNFQLELPPMIAHLPREYLVESTRPALLKDFFDPDLTITIRAKRRRKVVTIAVGAEQVDIPI